MPAPVFFPFEHNADEDLVEVFGFDTDILPGNDGQDAQRIQLRGFPLGALEVAVAGMDAQQVAHLQGLIRANQGGQWIVPLWPYAVRLDAALAGGETFLPCSSPATGYPLDIAIPWRAGPNHEGLRVALWQGWSRWQVFTFDGAEDVNSGGWGVIWGGSWGNSGGPATSGVHVVETVSGAWPASGAWVMPCRLAHLAPEVESEWLSSEIAIAPLRFTFDDMAA